MKLKTLRAKHNPYPIIVSKGVENQEELDFIIAQFEKQGIGFVFRKRGNVYSIWREVIPADVKMRDYNSQQAWFHTIRKMSKQSEKYEIVQCKKMEKTLNSNA